MFVSPTEVSKSHVREKYFGIKKIKFIKQFHSFSLYTPHQCWWNILRYTVVHPWVEGQKRRFHVEKKMGRKNKKNYFILRCHMFVFVYMMYLMRHTLKFFSFGNVFVLSSWLWTLECHVCILFVSCFLILLSYLRSKGEWVYCYTIVRE